MKNTKNPGNDAFELALGRVPAGADGDSLTELLTAYRTAAIGPAPRPSAALSARVDLTAAPLVMQRDASNGISTVVATRRAVTGLFGIGVTVAIILGAASGAAAVVSMGTAGLLPPGAQDVFDQVVPDTAPLGVVGIETTDQGEAPGVPAVVTPTPAPTGDGPVTGASSDDGSNDSGHESGTGNSGQNNGVGSSGEDNGFGNSGENSGTSDNSDDSDDQGDDDSNDSDDQGDDDSSDDSGKSDDKPSGESNGGGNSGKKDD
ncbi:hypothetical protein IWX81_000136 [Salinibacterium sp. CAN_S4]|uniref:hypothetical protein n=1 Tax=Salinibacterium sp. CAN_S4 TaxID=2787727 RepID=UPI0018EF7D78